MSALRCRPGDLCEVIASRFPENIGRRVVVESLDEPTDLGPMWLCHPLQPMWCTVGFDGWESAPHLSMHEGVIPDAYLRPVRDPLPDHSDTTQTEDTAPVEHGIAHA